MIRLSSFRMPLFALALVACSSDDPPSDSINANQPGGSGSGGSGGAGGTSSDPGGAAGSTANGAPGAEAQDPEIDLSTDDEAGEGPSSAGTSDAGAGVASDAGTDDTSLSFFVTSQNNTGNLGGIAGADAQCQTLAEAAGSTRTWAAYLSAENGGDGQPVNARDRIGTGPWFNALGVEIAANLDALHALASGDPELFLDENGERINGQWAGSPDPVEHDVMTGSDADGNLLAGQTCNSWTSAAAGGGGPRLGHADGLGPNMNGAPPFNSWNSSHTAPNCTAAGLQQVGGAGKIYCFASD